MGTSTSILEARNVGRRADPSSAWLLGPIDFSIEPGESLAIVGPSGSGKTLLLRALALLDPIDQGEVRWQGCPVHGARVPRFRSCVAYVRQRPAAMEGTVESQLEKPFNYRVYADRQYDRDRVIGLLATVDRDASFLSKPARELSGGEAQLVALLRVLQFGPDVLLLDEPTAALDPGTTRAVEDLVQQWRNERPDQRAAVWVSHDPEQAQRISDRRIRLDRGQIDSRE